MLSIVFLTALQTADAQTFGKNKPRYRSFDFKVEETPHFDIYHYLRNKDKVDQLGQLSEMWHDYHTDIFTDSLVRKNPLIFYNNHAEFQQTNAISGAIGVGTGGVTEALKNRVIMPLTYTEQQTSHVLGHELVHAFQYNSIIHGDSTNLRNLANLPLWLVEGLAEYMSIGRKDPFTAMWMRDAVIRDEIPEFKKLNNPKYFPYRYGQAAWSFFTGVYGDDIIEPFFMNTAKYGLEFAIDSTFNTSEENLSSMWKNALVTYYTPFIEGKSKKAPGTQLISKEKNGGRMNVSPTLSPDGKRFVFLSEKDVFSTDLFVADARNGKITDKLTSLSSDPSLDHLSLLESSGTWSPDGKQYAFVGFKKGRNVLVIKEVSSGKTLKTMTLDKVPAFEGPVWSPDGDNIVISGLVEGQVDLYNIKLRNERVTQLTDTPFSEIQADFNQSGSKLVFSYDERSITESPRQGKNTLDIAVMDVATGAIETLPVFNGADNISPQFDEKDNIYFVSNRDGFRNLYYYDTESGTTYQMTDLVTGISGITQYSPAVTASKTTDRVLYSYYFDNQYQIYKGKKDQFLMKEVDPTAIDQKSGYLPVVGAQSTDIVSNNLDDQNNYAFMDASEFHKGKYKPQFQLDYVGGGTGVGVGNNAFGTTTGLQGGVDMLFSDIMGNNQLFTQLALNGEIIDIGGQVSYLNRKNRLAYGVGISHIPLRTGYQNFENDQLRFDNGQVIPVVRRDINLIRIFNEGVNAFVHYPFSTTLRAEGGIQGIYQSFRQDRYSDYIQVDNFGRGRIIYSERNKVKTADEIIFNRYYTISRGFGATANVALVGDNSFFGLTAPLAGHRFRLSVEQSFGINDFTGFLADGRYYHRVSPFTLAIRATAYSRYEKETNTIYPFYIGNMGFVRGYGSAFTRGFFDDLNIEFDQLIGSKIALTSFEVRLPFTGPKQIALIDSKFLLTDLNLFIDAGVAYDNFSDFENGKLVNAPVRNENGDIQYDSNGNVVYQDQFLKPEIASSAGISLRVNLFGAMIIEPYYAWSLRAKGVRSFGVNIIPGW